MMWWQILELTAEADQKAIKLAYAKKLKKTRPDEDPEGFKALHEAYKQALAWYENKEVDNEYTDDWGDDQPTPNTSITSSLDSTIPESTSNLTELSLSFSAHQTGEQTPQTLHIAQLTPQAMLEPELVQLQTTILQAPKLPDESHSSTTLQTDTLVSSELAKPISPVIDNYTETEQQCAADWQTFQKQFSINLHTETARKDPQAWHFLERLPSFMDLEFRERLSNELFGCISEANLKAIEQKSLFIKSPVLQYLNQLFAWDQQWRYFTERFGQQQADTILAHTEIPTTHKQAPTRVQPGELYYYSRLLAFVIDLALVSAVAVGLSFVLEKPQNLTKVESNIFLLTLIWFIIYPLVEASTLQASLGKRFMKLKVVNKNGQKLSIVHSYIRHFVTNICLLGLKIVIWINMLLAYKRNMLLQDWLTQSYVIKRD